jgi:signal transduction histidine kinase
MPATRWLRSTSLRLAIGFAVIFALAALVPIGVLWWATAGSLSAGIRAEIRADATTLHHLYRDGGLAELRIAVASRAAAAGHDGTVTLLADDRLRPLAGSLEAWPAALGHATGWHDLELGHGDGGVHVRVYHARLAEGVHLLVGRDIGELIRLRTLILDAVAWSAVVAVALATMLGLLFRRVFLVSLRSIRATADAIAHGDISRRLPVAGSADEFDLLAGTLNELFGRIEELVAGVRNVSNAVAHDLRTPLAELRGRLEALQRRHAAAPEVAEGVEAAIADVDRLIAIFTALLRLADIDSGMRRSAFAVVDLGTVAADAGELYSALAEARDITLTLSLAPGLTVWGDRDLLAQAVSNLLDNALKFTPAGGTVTLSAADHDGRAELVVADSGPGLSDADRARATQRFFRGDRSRHTPGVGLGLSLVQAVADLHHATLELSDHRPGLLVRLALPKSSGGAVAPVGSGGKPLRA